MTKQDEIRTAVREAISEALEDFGGLVSSNRTLIAGEVAIAAWRATLEAIREPGPELTYDEEEFWHEMIDKLLETP